MPTYVLVNMSPHSPKDMPEFYSEGGGGVLGGGCFFLQLFLDVGIFTGKYADIFTGKYATTSPEDMPGF
jgi:hypothetical protein